MHFAALFRASTNIVLLVAAQANACNWHCIHEKEDISCFNVEAMRQSTCVHVTARLQVIDQSCTHAKVSRALSCPAQS